MSEKRVILLQDISSSQADTETVVRAAVSPFPLITLKRKLLERRGEFCGRFRGDQLKLAVCARLRLVRRQMWMTRTLMLLAALTRLGSVGTSLRIPRSQKSFVARDFPRRMCPTVSLTPLTFLPTLAGNKQLFHPSLPSQDAPFPSFDRKWTVLIRRRWTSKC